MGKDRSGQDAKLVGEARWKVSEVQPWGGGAEAAREERGVRRGKGGTEHGRENHHTAATTTGVCVPRTSPAHTLHLSSPAQGSVGARPS